MAFTATMLRPRCTLQLPTSPRRPNPRPTTAAPAPLPPVPSNTMKTTTVAAMWRQVHGSGDWDGLLRPLHPVLRGEVARYGALVGACYDALDMDRSSPGYMRCKHREDRMLHQAFSAGAGEAGYEVTRYIYAAPDVAVVVPPAAGGAGAAAWVGYVAVSTDEMTRRRDVLVAFRGTVTPAKWTANLMSLLRPARLGGGDARRRRQRHPDDDDDVKVESGFLNLYTSPAPGTGGTATAGASCREQLIGEVSRLLASFAGGDGDDVSVTLAGHSMGGAVALLLGYDLAELGLLDRRRGRGRRIPVSVLSFGAPRVGNAAFKARCDALGRTRRLLAGGGGGAAAAAWCYVHVGAELALDFASLRDLGSVHDLGAYVSCFDRHQQGTDDDGDRGGQRRHHRARRRRLTAASGGGARPGDRLQLTALGFLLFLYGSLHHSWPLISPLLITLFSNLSY
ncbi:unnamed protein product [Urochloa humidicola]